MPTQYKHQQKANINIIQTKIEIQYNEITNINLSKMQIQTQAKH